MENLHDKFVTTELSKYLSSAEDLIEEARNGRMFILVDDEDRENEGDLIVPAQFATPAAINFMARYARGLICLAMTSARVEKLGLPLMSQQNGTRHQTAFTVFGDTAGNAAARSAMCASPSLRIMLTPISVFISPAGWCELKTSMIFSATKMSSRRANTVPFNCGTYAIGASARMRFNVG